MGKFLVDPEDVRKRLFLPDIGGIRAAIVQATKATTEALESELRTLFDFKADQVDLFYVSDSRLVGSRFAEKFLLTRGLVTEVGSPVVVEVAPRKINLVQGDTVNLRDSAESDVVVQDPDQFVLVDPRRGVVTVQDFRIIRRYVQARYDAGIAADRNKPDRFLFADQQISMQGAPDLTFDAGAGTITRSVGSWVDDDFVNGDRLVVTGTTSNDQAVVADQVSALVVTVGANDVLVDEGPVSGASVVSNLQGVPAWLAELATVWVQIMLLTTPTLGQALGDQGGQFSNNRLVVDQLIAQLATLLDDATRYEPGANKVVC